MFLYNDTFSINEYDHRISLKRSSVIYLNCQVDGMDDKVELGETLRAMRTMGINDEEKDDIIALTAGDFFISFFISNYYYNWLCLKCPA